MNSFEVPSKQIHTRFVVLMSALLYNQFYFFPGR